MGEISRIDTSPGSPSVASAFAMLDLIAHSPGPVTMIQITRSLGLPKSSVSRVLRTLESLGAIVRDPADKRYTLGPKIEGYSRTASTPRVARLFERIATPIVQPLNETTQLGVLAGVDVRFAAYLDSTQPVRLVTYVGRTLPAHATATGKAILAFTPEARLERVIAAGLPAVTGNTITSPAQFREELDRVRTRGYATENEESADNLSCVSAPVLTDRGTAIAAVTMCFPSKTIAAPRFHTARDAVIDIAATISHALSTQLDDANQLDVG